MRGVNDKIESDRIIEPVATLPGEVQRRQSLLGMIPTEPEVIKPTVLDPSVKLQLTVCNAKSLAKVAKFGRSNAFVRIVWNGVPIASTNFIPDNNNPVWPDNVETFHLRVPVGWHLSECTL